MASVFNGRLAWVHDPSKISRQSTKCSALSNLVWLFLQIGGGVFVVGVLITRALIFGGSHVFQLSLYENKT